jgi:hypothetical protein
MHIENMRKALRLVESRAAFTLQHQPDDDAKCGEVLLEVLKGIEATASLAVKGIKVD